MYGIFHQGIPDLHFVEEEWTDEHYRMISSLMNHKRTFDRKTSKPVELLNERIIQDYLRSWILLNGADQQPIVIVYYDIPV